VKEKKTFRRISKISFFKYAGQCFGFTWSP
jgi:hypothetical protein